MSSFFFTLWVVDTSVAGGSLETTAVATVVRFFPFDNAFSLILSLILLMLLILLLLLLVLLLTLLDILPEVEVLLALLLLSLLALLASLLLLPPPPGAAGCFSSILLSSRAVVWLLGTNFTFHALKLLNTFSCSRRLRLGELIRWLFRRLVLFSVEMADEPLTFE